MLTPGDRRYLVGSVLNALATAPSELTGAQRLALLSHTLQAAHDTIAKRRDAPTIPPPRRPTNGQ